MYVINVLIVGTCIFFLFIVIIPVILMKYVMYMCMNENIDAFKISSDLLARLVTLLIYVNAVLIFHYNKYRIIY